MGVETRLIYGSDTLRAVMNPAGAKGPARIVTFESRGIAVRKDDRYFAAALATPDAPILHVIPDRDAWYQEPDLPALIDAIRPHLAADAFAYGSSMGGYAVARFADQIGVTRAVALSPQFSIDRTIAPFETRWDQQARTTRFLYDANRPARKALVWVFTDQLIAEEADHARLIAEEGPTHVIDTPGALHGCGPALREAGVLKPMVEAFLAGTEDAEVLRTQIAERLPQTSYGLMQKAKSVKGGRRLRLLLQAIDLNPRNTDALELCALVQIRLGDLKGAQLALTLLGEKVPGKLRRRFLSAAQDAGFRQQLFQREID
jgi:hypothetical protein